MSYFDNYNPFENAVPDFDFEGLKVPPWIKYPNIPLGSIGWRMGEGESYWSCFVEWWNSQSEDIKCRVEVKYPDTSWGDFYSGMRRYYES